MPLISVVIPAYNAEATLPETIASLQAQSFHDWEAILVEDGSQDGTWRRALSLAAAEPRLRVVPNPGKGPSDARNYGALVLARGRLLAFCDADDIWLPGKLASVAKALTEGKADAVFGQIGFFDRDPAQVTARSTVPAQPVDVAHLLGENPVCCMSNLSLRREVFRDLGGLRADMVHNEDLEFLIRLAGRGYRLQGLDEDHLRYRTSAGGLSSDLQRMEDGRRIALDTARGFGVLPDQRSEAIYKRYLARRALRLNAAPRQARAFALQGLRLSPSGFLTPLRRGGPTALAALAAPMLPATLRQSLFTR